MTDMELRRLRRVDLLELFLAQSKENEQLQQALEEAKAQLADRAITLEKAGSIAEASLQLSGVFQAAQEACAQYLENIQRLNDETAQRCAQLEQETQARCEAMVAEARQQCQAVWEELSTKAAQLSPQEVEELLDQARPTQEKGETP